MPISPLTPASILATARPTGISGGTGIRLSTDPRASTGKNADGSFTLLPIICGSGGGAGGGAGLVL